MHEACSRAPWVGKIGYLCIWEILVVRWLYAVHTPVHPSVCTTGKPIWNVTFCSWCGSLKHVFNLLIDIHIMVNWQLSSLGISWPESNECIAGSGANSSRSIVIMLSAAQLLAFNWLQAQVCVIHQLVLKSQWPPPKVNYRFVDFFVVVPSSLSEVLYKCRNRSFPFKALAKSTGLVYITLYSSTMTASASWPAFLISSISFLCWSCNWWIWPRL